MTFQPSNNVRRLTRKDSYVPDKDQDLETRVQALQDTLPNIPEENPTEGKYNIKDIKPQRSHTYRTSVQLDINPSKNNLRSIRYERRRKSQKRRVKENGDEENS